MRVLFQFLAGICAVWPFVGLADTGRVLDLCLDTSLTPEARLEVLSGDGWREADGTVAFAVALTLTRVNSGAPEGWADVLADSLNTAPRAIDGGDATYIAALDDSAGVFIGRNRTGLQICLYLGDDPDMSPLAGALDGSIVRTIGEVSRIRGDGVKSLISAHAMTDQGRAVFEPALPFGLTFTVVLDRQPGDLP